MKHTIVRLIVLTMFCIGANGLQAQTVKDIDGNVYKTVKIGTQVWMAENLKTTKYNDGKAIPLVVNNNAWTELSTPAYSWYNNDENTYKNKYGALYNWFAVSTNKLCPDGWHVPSDNELTTLTNFLGGKNVAGGKLKETGTNNWSSPNSNATNESGFLGFPSGNRSYLGVFTDIGNFANWWSSSENDSDLAWYLMISSSSSNAYRAYGTMRIGFSVRCLKNK